MYRARPRGVKERCGLRRRAWTLSCRAGALLVLACALPIGAAAQCPPLPEAGSDTAARAPAPPFACRFDAALTRLFTPLDVPRDTYRVYVTDAPITHVATAFRDAAPASHAEGAWDIQQMDPLDAYGASGAYDRARVACVYLGVRARVARGPIVIDDKTVRSMTLVSPYPDPTLSRLNPGTLIIEFQIPRSAVAGRQAGPRTRLAPAGRALAGRRTAGGTAWQSGAPTLPPG